MIALLFNTVTLPASVGAALRSVSRRVASSVSSSGALKHRMRCVGRLRKRCLVGASVPRLIRSLRLHPTDSSQVRAQAFPLRLSASAPGLDSHRHPPPPNNSFKPTPHRGVNSVLCATLARCCRPAVGRLNSSVRRQKSVWRLCFSTRGLYRLRLALLFGMFHAALLLRSGPSGALKPFTRYVGRLRKQ